MASISWTATERDKVRLLAGLESEELDNAKLDIFDFNMTHIVNLDNPTLINDEGQFIWNGQNQFNQEVANGVYFYRMVGKKNDITIESVGKVAKAK